MTKALLDHVCSSHNEPTTTMALGTVEQRVNHQVKELHEVVSLLRDLSQVHDKYAQEYSKLPLLWVPSLSASGATSPSIPASLQLVVGTLEQTMATMAQHQTALTSELCASVVVPLEAFEKQQHRQTKQLLGEISDALKSEKQLQQTLTTLVQRATQPTQQPSSSIGGIKSLLSRQPSSENNQSPETTDQETTGELALEGDGDPKKEFGEIHTVKEKRDKERTILRQRLMELDLTDEQQTAVVQCQLQKCLESFSRHTDQLLAALPPPVASTSGCSPSEAADGDGQRSDEDDDTDAVLRHCGVHVDATSWMISVFSQLLAVQDSMVKRLYTLVNKTHDPLPPNALDATTLEAIVLCHKQLLTNLADPISRTLRFSKQKQETIRMELLESMEDTKKVIHHTQKKVKDKETKQHQQQQQQSVGETTSSSTSMGMGVGGLTALGLRTAVAAWSKQLSHSPKKMMMMAAKNQSRSGSSGGSAWSPAPSPSSTASLSPSPLSMATPVVSVSPEQMALEKDLADARAYLAALEKTQATQQMEMASTLNNTSRIGVKTMELMVNDHLKNVTKALTIVSSAMARSLEKQQQQQRSESESDSHPSRGFVELLQFEKDTWSDSEWSQFVEVVEGNNDDVPRASPRSPETESSETDSEGRSGVEEEEEEEDDEENNDEEVSLMTEAFLGTATPSSSTADTSALRVDITGQQLWGESQAKRPGQLLDKWKRRVAQVLGRLWDRMAPFLAAIQTKVLSLDRDQWRLVVLVVVVASLMRLAGQVSRLSMEWHALATLQQENAAILAQLGEIGHRSPS